MEGEASATDGVILFSLGRGWAQASALVSTKANSANCLCKFFIFITPDSRSGKSNSRVITVSNRCRLRQITEVEDWLRSALHPMLPQPTRFRASSTNQGPFYGKKFSGLFPCPMAL